MTNLSSSEKIANYLYYSTKLARLGAKLRKDNRKDETWTLAEEEEWDAICDEIDPWFYSLSQEERDSIKNVEEVLSRLTRGESLI
jgi:hypothetical protein